MSLTCCPHRSRPAGPRALPVLIPALACLTLPATAAAHTKWFTTGPAEPLDPNDVSSTAVLIGLIAVAAATAAGWVLWRLRRGREIVPGPERFGATAEGRAAFYALAPAVLGAHLAVPLLVYGIRGRLFTPNHLLPGGWYSFVGLTQLTIALALFYGVLTRPAAVLLALLWLAGCLWRGPVAMLENLHYLGFAVFFFLAGRGPYAVDRLLLPRLEPSARLAALAPLALRIGVGVSLIVVAFTEKLANLDLSADFLQKYPLNFTAAWGMSMSDRTFTVWAGCVELLAGVFIAMGLFPRVIILIAWLPINLSLTVFNWTELVGHLPFYGAIAFLFVWTPGREDAELWWKGILAPPPASSCAP